MDYAMLGFVVLLVSVAATRFLEGRAIRLLDDAHRDLIAQEFAKSRAIGLLPLLGLAVAYALIARRIPEHAGLLGVVFGAVAAVLVGLLHVQGARKLKAAQLPASYILAWHTARAVQYGGLIGAMILLAIAKA